MYVGGVVKSFQSANLYARTYDKPQLFCYTGKATPVQSLAFASKLTKELVKSEQDPDFSEIEMLLMMHLTVLHPCPAGEG